MRAISHQGPPATSIYLAVANLYWLPQCATPGCYQDLVWQYWLVHQAAAKTPQASAFPNISCRAFPSPTYKCQHTTVLSSFHNYFSAIFLETCGIINFPVRTPNTLMLKLSYFTQCKIEPVCSNARGPGAFVQFEICSAGAFTLNTNTSTATKCGSEA